MDIIPYRFNEQVLALYQAVGWTAYTEDADKLERGFARSLLTLAAVEGDELLGLVRVVGDGETVVWIQDILVKPPRQRQGIGKSLLRAVLDRYQGVRQVMLMTDDSPATLAFYRSMGFAPMAELGCVGLIKR